MRTMLRARPHLLTCRKFNQLCRLRSALPRRLKETNLTLSSQASPALNGACKHQGRSGSSRIDCPFWQCSYSRRLIERSLCTVKATIIRALRTTLFSVFFTCMAYDLLFNGNLRYVQQILSWLLTTEYTLLLRVNRRLRESRCALCAVQIAESSLTPLSPPLHPACCRRSLRLATAQVAQP